MSFGYGAPRDAKVWSMIGDYVPQAKIRITLSGTGFNPDAVTRRIGLQPTTTRRVGEPVTGGARIKSRYDLWTYSHPSKQCLEVGDEIRTFLHNMRALFPRIKSTAEEFSLDIEIGVSIYMVDQAPSLNLDNRVLKDLAELGAEIDFDLYLLAENEE